MDITSLKKKRYIIQNAFAFLCLVLGLYIIFEYRHGTISKNQSIFWLSASLLPLVLFDFVASLLTRESIAKGVSIIEEKHPQLYIYSVSISGVLLLACIIGVIIYW
jgi:hypothetical protein